MSILICTYWAVVKDQRHLKMISSLMPFDWHDLPVKIRSFLQEVFSEQSCSDPTFTYILCLCFYQFEVSDILLWIAVPCFVYLYHFYCWIFKGWGQPVLFIPFFSLYLLQVELCPEQLLHHGCSNVLALLLPNITISLGAPFSFSLN